MVLQHSLSSSECIGVSSGVYPVSIAPMMDCTDRFYRYFMRQITRHTLLWTEMITADAVIHGDRDRLLGFDDLEHPIVIQLGGSDPKKLREAAMISEDWGYDEINLNVGCPSDRVQTGRFGACLMAEPELVAECVSAMRSVVKIPVSVKHRIGIDHIDRYEDMYRFVEVVKESGCNRFTVHARCAWLQGLSPKENRNIPPLRHEEVYRLKREMPELIIETNGGIKTIEAMREHLRYTDGVMLGRAAYDNPYLFAEVDKHFFDDPWDVPSRREVALAMIPYLEEWFSKGKLLVTLTRHMLGLFKGQRKGRVWRRMLSGSNPRQAKSAEDLILGALRAMEDE